MPRRTTSGTVASAPFTVKRDAAKHPGRIWSHIRATWLIETPEETVRQEFLPVLVNEYGYQLEQIMEELELTGRGTGHARADFVIWRSVSDKSASNAPLIIVECKSDNVTIKPEDYSQGDNYARIAQARFVVTHNSRETRFWRVRRDKMPGLLEEIEGIPHASASDAEIDELIGRLKVFKEDEFADLLHRCHNIIRNRDKLDPAAAFDEIAKILFVKVWVERELKAKKQRENLFTESFLSGQLGPHPLDELFQKTKYAYRRDSIFAEDDRIRLKKATGEAIVKELERYNLSDTSEDVKGIAFERFLGRTFRGEIGQFFTPRSIVEFMIRMIAPEEGEIVCDPASGSGGFLIRFFEMVREQIHADVDRQYKDFKSVVDADNRSSEAKKAEALRRKYAELQADLDQRREDSRLWRLANRCIYGCDANDRMARTSKMNMIMHGDGHGGVHHHDGFLNVNGIFEGRFDVVLTNPPFGSSVEPSDVVLESVLEVADDVRREYRRAYPGAYDEAQSRLRGAVGRPIASMFQLPMSAVSEDCDDVGPPRTHRLPRIKTQLLFIERCLDLLVPGGRLGIVLPESVFNNPSLSYVRVFVEDRAFIRAVISLPDDTFKSSGASVKCSLLFLQKFTEEERTEFEAARDAAIAETKTEHQPGLDAEIARLNALIDAQDGPRKVARTGKDDAGRRSVEAERKRLTDQLAACRIRGTQAMATEARKLLKRRFDYSVFLYDAQHVGITATGEPDANELFPNPNTPPGIAKSALEEYREFRTSQAALNPRTP